jgi:hypothetical protein
MPALIFELFELLGCIEISFGLCLSYLARPLEKLNPVAVLQFR